MSNFFIDLEDSVGLYNSSNKESINDIALDGEEVDKIIHELTSSNSSNLNVDYSEFANHVFFGSAYACVNFAASRIIENYPLAGELKQKNGWHASNSGFENWFFEQWPKQQGYVFIQSGSNYVSVFDYEGLLNFNSASRLGKFTAEAMVAPYANIPNNSIYPICSFTNEDSGFSLYINQVADNKFLNLKVSSSTGLNLISCSYNSFVSSSHHVAAKLSENSLNLYIDGNLSKTQTLVYSGSITFGNKFDVGFLKSGSVDHYYSGSVDDVRFWTSDRDDNLILRNHNRTIHSNISGGLKLYWKFNHPQEYGNKIVDFSGYSLHGVLTGSSFSVATNIKTGSLGSWFSDNGDPIFSLENQRVDSFLEEQRLSASNYDDQNENMIFNLVPSYFIDGDDTEYQQLFLLLTARHYDRLKLYIDNISNITNLTTANAGGPPSNLLDIAAQHYGLSIGSLFSDADPLQYYFGENINSFSGTIYSTIKNIKESLKRNVLSNLSYILKTKSTRQSTKAALAAIGIDENIVSISEYSDLSGGIQTTYTPRTIEERVANFQTSSLVFISSSAYDATSINVHQVRTLFLTSSSQISQSVLSFHSAGVLMYGVSVERNNATSSAGIARLYFRNNSNSLLSITSSADLFNNNWINFTVQRNPSTNYVSLHVTSADRNELLFSSSASQAVTINATNQCDSIFLGSSGTNYFSGFMHEFRAWHGMTYTDQMIYRWGLDWKNTEIQNLEEDFNKLKHHLKLNDFTSSASTNGGPINDSITVLSGSSFFGFTSSSLYNFPGKYIDIHESCTSYDLNVDNDKIRIKSGSNFYKNDETRDIPFVSINFSPINSLNKEIFKWVGDVTKLSNVIGETTNQYRTTNAKLNSIKYAFFNQRVNSKIDYEKFSELIKWFDSNFAQLISQLVPVDIKSSISSYIIEPHLLENNSVKKPVASSDSNRRLNLLGTIVVTPVLTSSTLSTELSLVDPGRFGSFVSASARISKDAYFNYGSASSGINFRNTSSRNDINSKLRDNVYKTSPRGYGNGFITHNLTGANYLKSTLNVIPNFSISGVFYKDSGDLGTRYLSSSQGAPTFSSNLTFDGVQDARWLWIQTSTSGGVSQIVDEEKEQWVYDTGIGYGGMWGQLRFRSGKSIIGSPTLPPGSIQYGTRKGFIGEGTVVGKSSVSDFISTFNRDNLSTTMIWPMYNAYDGVELFFTGSQVVKFADETPAESFGPVIDIEGFNTLNVEILGRTNKIAGYSNSTSILFEIKFQFFSRETPGDFGFETVLSSSKSGGTYTNNATEVKYRLSTGDLPKNQLLNFNLSFERSLPKQKFMRVFITPSLGEDGNIGSTFVLVKGILSNNERTVDDLPIRSM